MNFRSQFVANICVRCVPLFLRIFCSVSALDLLTEPSYDWRKPDCIPIQSSTHCECSYAISWVSSGLFTDFVDLVENMHVQRFCNEFLLRNQKKIKIIAADWSDAWNDAIWSNRLIKNKIWFFRLIYFEINGGIFASLSVFFETLESCLEIERETGARWEEERVIEKGATR